MNEHWLQQTYKDTKTDELQAQLNQLQTFNGSPGLISAIKKELARREGKQNV